MVPNLLTYSLHISFLALTPLQDEPVNVSRNIGRCVRVLESRQRIASEHPEIVSMRNKAAQNSKKGSQSSLGKGGKDSAEGGERVRIDRLRTKVREMLHGHRIRLVDAFRVFDANNSKKLAAASFEKMLMYFDPSKKTISGMYTLLTTHAPPRLIER